MFYLEALKTHREKAETYAVLAEDLKSRGNTASPEFIDVLALGLLDTLVGSYKELQPYPVLHRCGKFHCLAFSTSL